MIDYESARDYDDFHIRPMDQRCCFPHSSLMDNLPRSSMPRNRFEYWRGCDSAGMGMRPN